MVADGSGETRTLRGSALDLRETPLDAATLVDAIDSTAGRPEGGPTIATSESDAPAAKRLVRVETPDPCRWWRALADPTDGTPTLDRLVAAARSRGDAPPELRSLAAAERDLAGATVESVDVAERREHLAETGAEVDRLREEAATIRGRLQARRAIGADTADAASALSETMRRLSEAETDRLAAEQALGAAERAARTARAGRRRRLRLQDRVANRRRDARRALVAGVADAFDDAVDRVPGTARLETNPLGVAGDPVSAGLAAVRVATLDAPVVVSGGRFPSAAAAAAVLGAPVVRC